MARAAIADAFFERAAGHAHVPFVVLDPSGDSDPVDPAAAALLTPWAARALGVVPISADGLQIVVALSRPGDETALSIVSALTQRRPVPVMAAPEAILRAQARVYASATAATADEDVPVEETGEEPALALVGPPHAQRLGELLVAANLIDRAQLEAALLIQRRTGDRLGKVLVHAALIDESALTETLARQLRLPLVDVEGFTLDPDMPQLLPEAVARRHRIVPLAIADHVLYLASSEAPRPEALAEIRRHTRLSPRVMLASTSAVEELLNKTYAARYVRIATTELLNRAPEESAYRTLVLPQAIALGLIALAVAVAMLRAPIETFVVFNVGSVVFYTSFSLYKFRLMYHALGHRLELPVSDAEVQGLDERDLPLYTILVPLYREATVATRLVRSIAQIDYPAPRLDIKLLCEEDDEETIEAIRAAGLPPHFKLIVVPHALPKTKPKACNYGLLQAEGKYVVIYDAEDRPEPDQLKKIVAAFAKAESHVVCIQCKLNYYNRSQNILTRWFTSEYANWFDLLMPGLDATDVPIPLGGTSNHFIRDRLLELGAWDPFNVTEDADLGIRLSKAGYKTAMVDSTTYEEANSELYNWIRQRSRWVKGYIQTWLVHMRHPVTLWRQLGPRGFFSFQMIVGGTVFSFLLNPVYWLLTSLWLLTEAHLIRQLFPSIVYYAAAVGLYVGNFVFTYVNVAGCLRRGYYDLVKFALLSPLYWALMSVGAYKGLVQLVYRPHYWEKTVHGLDIGEES